MLNSEIINPQYSNIYNRRGKMSFVINEPTLEKLDNKALQELFLKVRARINAAYRKKEPEHRLKALQVDMCYVQREIEFRAKVTSKSRN
jgi:hypothetical protein